MNKEVELMAVKETAEKVNEVNPVAYTSLTKPELIEVINSKDLAATNYQTEIEKLKEQNKRDVDDVNNYYTAKLKEVTSLVKYYERKLNMIKQFIDIEQDPAKTERSGN